MTAIACMSQDHTQKTFAARFECDDMLARSENEPSPRATIPYRLALTNFAIGHDVIGAGFPRLSVSASRHIFADGEITVHSQAIHD